MSLTPTPYPELFTDDEDIICDKDGDPVICEQCEEAFTRDTFFNQWDELAREIFVDGGFCPDCNNSATLDDEEEDEE